MIITRSGRATEPKRAYVFRGCFFSLLSLFLLCFSPCVVCLMCVSWKINTAKLRKINKCQRSTRSLSHLTIITLIWDLLTNLLCPHLSRHWLRQRQPETGDWRLERTLLSASIANRFGLQAENVESWCFVLSSGTTLSSTEVSLCCVLC